MLALLVTSLLSASAYDGRALHWVIRVSSLQDTLTFAKEVLGMHVLRHEENEAACPITCNGKFRTPWSKTMIGYTSEDKAYALELTYNYGITSYQPGQGLQRFVLTLPDAAAKLARGKELGYAPSGEAGIIGPDGYVYEIRLRPEVRDAGAVATPEEPFSAVVLRATDAPALAAWYADVLGMEAPRAAPGKCSAAATSCLEVGYSGPRAVRFFIGADGLAPTIEQWEGRSAIALPETHVRAINKRVMTESPELVVHRMQELDEKLGVLVIVILKDPQGYELCLVSSETFDPSVAAAYDPSSVPDWEKRTSILANLPVPEHGVGHGEL